MPVRTRRLIFHGVFLLATVSWLYPLLRFLLPARLADREVQSVLSGQGSPHLGAMLSFFLIAGLLYLAYATISAGLFLFYRWARMVYTGFGTLIISFYIYNEWMLRVSNDFFWNLRWHVPLLVVVLILIWTPFVGGEFRRTARNL
ncbi:MAG: hypothetical protein AAGK14_14850 [Verrucomicrobiota bacterium]